MDLSGSCFQLPIKPPWEMVEFQSSIFPDETFKQALASVQYSNAWSEIPHETLNTMKSRIEPLEQNHTWESLKKKTNPYELVYTQEGNECPPSLCILKPLSRSYFKMLEILQISDFFNRLPKQLAKLRSGHVAEGPGGFMEAFLYGADLRRLRVNKIFAMTLKPTNNHIPGWRRTYHFLQRYPDVIKIHYGEDGTGDLYVPGNQKSFVDWIEGQKVALFTGDGGFDFSVDYENQEKSAFLLLVASSIIGLQVLQQEGMFVLKLFDIFSESTHYLLRLITACFRDWTLYKPATSRPCNSERYVVCRGFRRAFPEILAELRRIQERGSAEGLFPQPGFFSFFQEKEKDFLKNHMDFFHTIQLERLERTLQLATKPANEFSWKHHYSVAQQWCSQFHVPTANLKALVRRV